MLLEPQSHAIAIVVNCIRQIRFAQVGRDSSVPASEIEGYAEIILMSVALKLKGFQRPNRTVETWVRNTVYYVHRCTRCDWSSTILTEGIEHQRESNHTVVFEGIGHT